jgi:hypothetical protein
MPGSSTYPVALDTTTNLFEVANNAISSLVGAISTGDTSLTLANAANFPSSGAISIDSEILYYTGKSTNTLTGVSRGQDGTTAASHNAGAAVEMRYTASHHAVLNAAIRALQAKLGIGASSAATGQFLRGNGAGSSAWATIQAADLPQIALGSAMVTGILPVANGGTGSNSQNFVDLTNNQTSINGNKTFVGVSTLGSGTSYNEAAAASQGANAQAVRITTGSAGSPNATNLPVISAQKQSSANLLSSESEIPFLFSVRKQSGGGNLYALYSAIRQESATLTDSSALTGNSFIDPVGYVLNAPSATPSASGGTLATGTYYYKVTAIIGGVETIASWEASAAVTGPTGSVGLSWGAVTGASQYKVYRSTTSEAQDTRIKTTASTSYVDNGTTEGAATPPAQTNWAMWGRIERTGPVRLSGAEFGISNTTGVDASRLPQSTNATFGVNIVGTGNATTTTARNNTAGIIFQSGFPLGKFYTGIYFSANTVVDYGIDFKPLGTVPVAPIRYANNSFPVWRNAADSADVQVIGLTNSNQVSIAPGAQTTLFGGDVTLTGSARRLLADMSDPTISNRFHFQTSVPASSTVVGFIPSAGGSASAFRAFNNSDPANASFAGFLINSAAVQVSSTLNGTGTQLPMQFIIGSTLAAQISTGRSFVIGNAALATNATDGFLYIPGCAGTPTGTPSAFTGSVAMVYDTTASKLWIYNGSWRSATLT